MCGLQHDENRPPEGKGPCGRPNWRLPVLQRERGLEATNLAPAGIEEPLNPMASLRIRLSRSIADAHDRGGVNRSLRGRPRNEIDTVTGLQGLRPLVLER